MEYLLDFEKPVHELESKIKELQLATGEGDSLGLGGEIASLQAKIDKIVGELYQNLSSWERVQLSRHPLRPHAIDYIENIIEDFHEIKGDRHFSNDESVILGLGKLGKHKVLCIGIEKGLKTQDKIKRNFGMPNPEGYRKAKRGLELANRFKLPVVTFVDTPGAYPGIGAEQRGQSMAIAENLETFFGIKAPIVSVVIGEGGSGGALGIAVSDKVFMMEYSVYSVISPESCASILWSDPKMAEVAANALQLGPEKALELGVIDGIIKEPIGGAHRDSKKAIKSVRYEISKSIDELSNLNDQDLLDKRFEKYRSMGNKFLVKEKNK